ncbi:amino acid adenylation domain-containing protein [Streptomyces sp. NPDC001904]|uniref:non-ribosomal peptide synthetase n=1 Tax=Streptomyces sp. NPDC001904 TaxID=3154531 RepID=UPI00332618A7
MHPPTTLSGRFLRRAANDPSLIAVRGPGTSDAVSYGDLAQRAQAVCDIVLAHDVAPGGVVGLCAPPSSDFLAGLLGILQAGCVWLPLDPQLPPARREAMVADADAALLLTGPQGWNARKTGLPEADLVSACRERCRSTTTPTPRTAPDDVAYVLFTSGSTGHPKGVRGINRGVLNVLDDIQEKAELRPADRCAWWCNPSFDVSIYECFSALLQGCELLIPDPALRADADAYTRWLAAQSVCGAYVPGFMLPALLQRAQSHGTGPQLALTRLLVGVEPIAADVLTNLTTALPALRILNGYGPTEASICATLHLVDAQNTPQHAVAPIGRPVRGIVADVLDEDGDPVRPGEVGELHLGGANVVPGYLDPDLTADRFWYRAAPQGQERSRRYRTGDLVRELPGRDLMFVGRADDQVKIRGHRVEPEEVRKALLTHPDVVDAAVTVWERTADDRRLVAHVVARADSAVDTAGLREHLASKLPPAMVPSHITFLDRLPRTANGKVDRDALATPDHWQDPASCDEASADDPVAACLADVLGLPGLGADDDFFLAGGHSLTAVTAAARLAEQLDLPLPSHTLYVASTPRRLHELEQWIRAGGDVGSFTAEEPAAEQYDLTGLQVSDTPPPAGPARRILLTGATGYVGVHLLAELQRSTTAHITCLVRAGDRHSAEARVRDNLARRHLPDDLTPDRVAFLPGDLAAPRLGLDEQDFRALAHDVDHIFHTAALVDQVAPATVLRGANIDGTRTLIELAATGQLSWLHHISTMSVYWPRGHDTPQGITEQTDTGPLDRLLNGYAHTKLHAEHLATSAAAAGVPVTIHRLGSVTGHTVHAGGDTDTFLYRDVIGCIQMGRTAALDYNLMLTPVDFATTAVRALALNARRSGEAYNITLPGAYRWSQLVERLAHRGYPLDVLPYEKWVAALHDDIAQHHDNALAPLLPLLSRRTAQGPFHTEDHYTPVPSSNHHTLQRLADLGIAPPPTGHSVADACITDLQQQGKIPSLARPFTASPSADTTLYKRDDTATQ